MFWSKRAREFNLQLELDMYETELDELIATAWANSDRAFAECYRSEWNYWKNRATDTLPKKRGWIDHARGGSGYWVRAVRGNMEAARSPRPYGRFISRDDDGQPLTDAHNKRGGIFWEPDDWYVPNADPQPDHGHAMPFRVQIWRSSEWVDVQSFDTREAAEAFASGISDTKTRIKEGSA